MRPPCKKTVKFDPKYKRFLPEGCPKAKLDSIQISREEAEALRLKDVEDLDQTQAAGKMGISQSTFQRLLSSGHKKVAQALILGKEICIENNN